MAQPGTSSQSSSAPLDGVSALLEHISELRLHEIDGLQQQRAGGLAGVTGSDRDLALLLFAEEAEGLLNVSKDHMLGRRYPEDLLDRLIEMEETARYDRALALALAEGRPPPPRPPRLRKRERREQRTSHGRQSHHHVGASAHTWGANEEEDGEASDHPQAAKGDDAHEPDEASVYGDDREDVGPGSENDGELSEHGSPASESELGEEFGDVVSEGSMEYEVDDGPPSEIGDDPAYHSSGDSVGAEEYESDEEHEEASEEEESEEGAEESEEDYEVRNEDYQGGFEGEGDNQFEEEGELESENQDYELATDANLELGEVTPDFAEYMVGPQGNDIPTRGASDISEDESLVSEAEEESEADVAPAQEWRRAPSPALQPGDLCCICGDDISGTIVNLACGHTIDTDCLRDMFERAAADESLFPPQCCKRAVELSDVESFLDRALVDRFQKKAREFRTANRVYCYSPYCSAFLGAATLSPQTLRCPECASSTCASCKERVHPRTACRTVGDAALLDLAKTQGWQRCVSCQYLVERRDGCPHMQCRCGAQFCYLCGSAWGKCNATCPRR